MSASLKNTIKALLNVEAIFMTDLHCQLFNALCFVYLPLRNQQFVKYHQDIFLKVVIPSDGFAYILVFKKKKKERNMIVYLFATMPWKLYLVFSNLWSQHIESQLVVSLVCKSDHCKFQENVLVMSIRAVRLISRMVKLHLPHHFPEGWLLHLFGKIMCKGYCLFSVLRSAYFLHHVEIESTRYWFQIWLIFNFINIKHDWK